MTLTAASAVSALKCVFSYKLRLAFYHCCELCKVSIFSLIYRHLHAANHYSSSISHHRHHFPSLSRHPFLFFHVRSFLLSCLLEPDFLLGGGSEYEGPRLFQGTTTYERHSRELGEVTSVFTVCPQNKQNGSFFLPQQTETKHC